jgi:putative effector of murein hydrolase
VTGITSAGGLVWLLGGSWPLIATAAPKSVTTPIAIELSEHLGGIESLTVAMVIGSGILGASIGPEFLEKFRIRDRLAVGLAMGAASHGIGTARMIEEDKKCYNDLGQAMSIIGMTLNGLITSILMPWLASWLQMNSMGNKPW